MNLETYLTLPISKRKEIINETNIMTAPLWQERLFFAIKHNSPAACSFNRELTAEYWTLKRSA